MTKLSRAVLVISLLGLSACSNGGGGLFGGRDNGPSDQMSSGIGDPTSIEFFQQNVGDRVLFEVDQSTLNSDAMSILNAQAQWLNSNVDYSIVIEGHADEQGTREYNLALGARRAAAVQEYLGSMGVSSNRMRTVSFGKERPLQICSDESCYSQNRRAVTILNSGLGS